MPEDPVMAEPEEPDHGEADAETDEARLVDAEMRERGRVRAVKQGFLQPAGPRDFQVDGEQSDRDREDGVAAGCLASGTKQPVWIR
jgi:hypothetical protein